jgi:hypothetical protein
MEEVRRVSLASARRYWLKESMLLRKINGKDFGGKRTLEIIDWSRVERMVGKAIEQPALYDSIE